MKIKHLLLAAALFALPAYFALSARAQTPDETIAVTKRVHGGFGSYLALGLRIGEDAVKRLGAAPRELDVTYFSGKNAPCPCVVDGIMVATTASPGQGTLRVAAQPSAAATFGVALIHNLKTGRALRYTIPAAARSSLDWWNKTRNERGRFDAVMQAPQEKMFRVQVVASPRAAR